MNARENVTNIARREYVERIRDRGFWLLTGFILLVLVVGIVAPQVIFDEGDPSYTVAVAGEDAAPLVAALPAASDAAGGEITVTELAGGAEAEAAVRDEEADIAVTDGTLLTRDDPPDALVAVVQSLWRQVRAASALEAEGVPAGAAQEALNPPPLAQRSVKPEADEDEVAANTARIGVFLIFFIMFFSGFAVAQGVVEEKASRVVELVLAAVRPVHMLTGKVIGIGLIGLTQLVILAGIGLAAALGSGLVTVTAEVVGPIVQVLIWFVPGFLLLTALFAMAGAVVSRTEDLQNSAMAAQTVFMVSYFAAIFTGFEPDSTGATVASFVPTVAPMLMPVRIAAGVAPLWQILVAYALLVACAVALLPVTARVYAGGILQMRGRVKMLEAFRSA
jgi:ABC-2 type transport system permease protein